MRRSILAGFFALLLAACEGTAVVPLPPPVTVMVTAVDYTTAVPDGVALALTGTAANPVAMTETHLARVGVSLTPSLTPSDTATPHPATATRWLTPTPSPIPSATTTPTYAPFPTSVPDTPPPDDQGMGRLRVLNAWVADEGIDVYINNVRISRGLNRAEETAYQAVSAGVVRVTVGAMETDTVPLISQLVEVPAGGSVSVVVADIGTGLTLLPVVEDTSPLPVGTSRLTMLQANPALFQSNVLIPSSQQALAYDFAGAQLAGPYDIPSHNYRLEFYDKDNPHRLLTFLNEIQLSSQVNYLMVLIPARLQRQFELTTDYILFAGTTYRAEHEINVRFINAASRVGPITIQWNGQTQLTNIDVGQISVPVPLPAAGTQVTLVDEQMNVVAEAQLVPYDQGDEIVLIHQDSESEEIQFTAYSQLANTSTLEAHIRLTNILPDIPALSLEVREASLEPFNDSGAASSSGPWDTVTDGVAYNQHSSYTRYLPAFYDIRVTLAGTDTAVAEMQGVLLLVGGIYDFVVAPGAEPGSVRLLLVQPDVQTSLAFSYQDSSLLTQIEATLTAVAPSIAGASNPTVTPLPTITPVFTNTPHPTYTPSVNIPSLIVNPAPPEIAVGTFLLLGQHFAPNQDYFVSVLPGGRRIHTGVTNPDGILGDIIVMPVNMSPGLHVVRVCVGCTPGGAQQEAFAVINGIPPTPTPTPRYSPTPTPRPTLQVTPTPTPSGPVPPSDDDDDGDDDRSPERQPTSIPPTSVGPTREPPPPPPPDPTDPPPDDPPPPDPTDPPPDDPPPDDPPPDDPPPDDPPPDDPPDDPPPDDGGGNGNGNGSGGDNGNSNGDGNNDGSDGSAQETDSSS